MRSVIRTFLVLMISFIILSFQSLVLAQETKVIPKQGINPDSPYYDIKRLWEKINEQVRFSQQSKIEYSQILVENRLSELSYIAEEKQLDYFETSSNRLSAQAGIVANLAVKLASSTKKAEIVLQFNQYIRVLEKLRDLYPANSSYWLLIQQNIDTLKILSEKLK